MNLRTSMQGFNGGGGGGKVFLVVTAREIFKLEIKTLEHTTDLYHQQSKYGS